MVSAEARGFVLGARGGGGGGAGFILARKPGKLPREVASVEYELEYGVDALEVHADAVARRRARAGARRPARHGRHRGGAVRAGGAGGRRRGRMRVRDRAGVPRRPRAARRATTCASSWSTTTSDGASGRERVVAGAPDDVWRIVSDPGSPAALVAGRVSAWRTRRRRPGRRCSRLPKGKTRARRLHASSRRASRERLALAAGGRGVAVRAAALASRAPRSTLEPEASGGTRVRLTLDQRPRGWARFGPFQLRAAARAAARGRARRAWRSCSGSRRADALVGLGRGRPRRRAAARRRASCCATSSAWTRRAAAPPVALEEVSAARIRACPAPARERLAAAVGAEHVRDDARGARRPRGRAQLPRPGPDPLRRRLERARRRACCPGSAEEVAAVLAACAGGAGGGRAVRRRHERGGRRGAAARRASRRGRRSTWRGSTRPSRSTAPRSPRRLDAGLFGPEAERRLGAEGLTLGHFPQSFEYSTVGGWVATRSAGQASTGYGRIDELVEGVRCVDPGRRDRARAPCRRRRAGPCLRELLVGSEGVLGVITEATLRVRPAPDGAPLRGLVVPSVRGGLRGVPRAGAGGRRRRTWPGCRTRTRRA